MALIRAGVNGTGGIRADKVYIYIYIYTVITQISALGAYLISEGLGWALIRGGRLIEGGAYFLVILKVTRNINILGKRSKEN